GPGLFDETCRRPGLARHLRGGHDLLTIIGFRVLTGRPPGRTRSAPRRSHSLHHCPMSVRVTVDNPLTYRKIAVISDAEDPRSPRPGVARGVVPPAGRKPLSREPKREVVGHCHVLLLLAGALAAGPAVAAEVKPVGSAAGDARAFIETAERRLQDLSIRVDRA